MNFDIYIIGGVDSVDPYYGSYTEKCRELVADNIPYRNLKRKVKQVLDNLARRNYNHGQNDFVAYEVYPAGATPDQFPAYNLLTDDPVPDYNEFIKVRNGTGNFDTHQRWSIK